ncbi:MAG TPA: hypothetical protein VLN91_05285, partial [Nitrospirota bacterium]|nr:hypothetical protein [Nitrospirota bacterium]
MEKYIVILRSLGFLLALSLLSLPLYAEECSPFQFGLWPSIQLVPKDRIVCGIRLDPFVGDNAEVWGLDAGLINIAKASKGLQMGGVNYLDSKDSNGGNASWGIQAAVVNYVNKINY